MTKPYGSVWSVHVCLVGALKDKMGRSHCITLPPVPVGPVLAPLRGQTSNAEERRNGDRMVERRSLPWKVGSVR